MTKVHVTTTISYDCPSSDLHCIIPQSVHTDAVPADERTLWLKEVAALVGVDRRTILRWEDAGHFPARLGVDKYGKQARIIWRKSDVEKWIRER